MRKIALSFILITAAVACNKNTNLDPQQQPGGYVDPQGQTTLPDGTTVQTGDLMHCRIGDDRGDRYSYDISGDQNSEREVADRRGGEDLDITNSELTIQRLGGPRGPASTNSSLVSVPVEFRISDDGRGQKTYHVIATQDTYVGDFEDRRGDNRISFRSGEEILRIREVNGRKYSTSSRSMPGMGERQNMDCE